MLFVSCMKGGCIDEYALNYSSEAKSDNGSCIYPTQVSITGVRLTYLTISDTDGTFWDNTSTVDLYIQIENAASETLLKTTSKIDDVATIEWELNPAVVITDDDFSASTSIYIYDEDSDEDDLMGA